MPTITLGPGFTPVPNYNDVMVPDPAPQIPEGFTPLFKLISPEGFAARHAAAETRSRSAS